MITNADAAVAATTIEPEETAAFNPAPDSPAEPTSDLLTDLAQVWGRSVGIDARSAKAIILTVAGGIAGNTVRASAPKVGEVGTDLQIALARDAAPALRRGMQRLLATFESCIVSMLREYEHLSSPRAQRNELAALEAQLNVLMIRYRELENVTGNDHAMMNLAMQKQETQTLTQFDEVGRQVGEVRARIRNLRFRMRPMVMVQELGIAEIDSIPSHAFDSAVLEIVAAPGHLGRLAMMKERNMERLAAFRRNSGWASRLEFANGEYRPRAAVSTVMLAGSGELLDAWSDRLLAATGYFDEMLVCSPSEPGYVSPNTPDPGERWAELVHNLFAKRLSRIHTMFTLDDEARKRFEELRTELFNQAGYERDRAAIFLRETGPPLVIKLALCARLFRDEEGSHISVADLEVGRVVADHLLWHTGNHMAKVKTRLDWRRERVMHDPKEETVTESPIHKMVRKLRRIGPCTKRTLFRTYSSQDYPTLQPVLDRAIEFEMILQEGSQLRVAYTEEENEEDGIGVNAAACQ